MKKLLVALALCALLACPICRADTLTGQVQLRLISQLDSSAGFGAAREKIDHLISRQWSSGVGTYSIDVVYTAERSLAAGASETINLVDGSLTGGIGQPIVFGHVKAVCVESIGTTTITIGSGTNPILFLGATSTAPVVASGALLLIHPSTGYVASTTTSATSLHVEAAAGGTGTYRIWAVGTSE